MLKQANREFPRSFNCCCKEKLLVESKSPEIFSYLNLSRYKEFSNINQTPSTAPTQLFEHLEKVIDNFNILKLRDKINSNSKKITDAIGIENIIGETVCPVITFNKKLIATSVARKFNLYGLNTKSNNYQIFTYSCDDHEYESFAMKSKNEKKLYCDIDSTINNHWVRIKKWSKNDSKKFLGELLQKQS